MIAIPTEVNNVALSIITFQNSLISFSQFWVLMERKISLHILTNIENTLILLYQFWLLMKRKISQPILTNVQVDVLVHFFFTRNPIMLLNLHI